jgi:Putative Ig domain
MNITGRRIGFFQRNPRQIRPRATSRLLLSVIGMLVVSLVGCGGNNSTNNHPVALLIATGSLPSGTVGAAYQQPLAASGGTAPYTWSLTSASNTLPAGLTLNSAGVITGTPTTAETFSFSVQVTDSSASTAAAPLSITINPAALLASATALNFTTSTAQTFTVSGGTGTVTESDDCVSLGVASVTPPPSGVTGTWTVSPLSNGTCSISFTDGSGTSVSVSVSVNIQSTDSSNMTIQMEESSDCNNVAIYFKFFDETDNLVWPAPPNAYFFPYSNEAYSTTISCQTGAQICYGGSFYTNTEQPDYWGVGINNDESCPNCCYTCENTTTPVNLLNCSARAAATVELNDTLGFSRGRARPAPVGRGPVWEGGKETLK